MFFGMFGRKKAAPPSDNSWPFECPRNQAVITLESIVLAEKPILRVVREAGEGGWQFLSGGQVEAHEAKVVSLASIVELDPSVLELGDLPEGWFAERRSIASEWESWPLE